MSQLELIPFGKYKGQPVEVLQQDRQYYEWLVAQSWFRQQYPQLQTIIINNFGQPSETPEHNAMQIKFLDEAFCRKFHYVLSNVDIKDWDFKIQLESRNIDVSLIFYHNIIDKSRLMSHFRAMPIDKLPPYAIEQATTIEQMEYLIEIKPSVSDDYPAILRQMKSNGSKILYLDSYTGIGATEQQFIQFFKINGISIVFDHQITL